MSDPKQLPAETAVPLSPIVRLAALVREVMKWHADSASADYNECEKAPCEFCRRGEAALRDASKQLRRVNRKPNTAVRVK